ncbi:hypothetical protein [Flavobacterium rhizosphaerae]|uniref:Uncharacterized protein n=1 Tax=Flavobacterium rhizosphaerae TaxID=3163298 RepID=A0ABW8YWK3_9FLAO
MNKKTLNIILLFFVLGLWGVAGYRFFKNTFATTAYPTALKFDGPQLGVLIIKRDTFLLNPVQRDPFLDNVKTNPVRTIPKPARRLRTTILPTALKPAVNWPEVNYFGYIKAAKNDELALIKIDKVLYKMHKKETRAGLTLKNIYKDSAQVLFNKELKIIKRN